MAGDRMKINQIRYFLDVAETGSINRSALNLYISPQGLSRSIAQLEKGLGFNLFARSNRGMVLTEEGRSFIGPASRMQEAYRQFEHDLSIIAAHSPTWSNESLELQMPPLLTMPDELGNLLDLINESYPTLQVNVTERNSFDLVPYAKSLDADQLQRTCMVATVPDYLLSTYLEEERFSITKIYTAPMAVLAERNHPLAQRHSITRAEMAQERIACFDDPMLEDIVHHLLDEFGRPDFVLKGSIRNLVEHFPGTVMISAERLSQARSKNIASVPLQDTVQVHVIAITANPIAPLIGGIIDCIREVYR